MNRHVPISHLKLFLTNFYILESPVQFMNAHSKTFTWLNKCSESSLDYYLPVLLMAVINCILTLISYNSTQKVRLSSQFAVKLPCLIFISCKHLMNLNTFVKYVCELNLVNSRTKYPKILVFFCYGYGLWWMCIVTNIGYKILDLTSCLV